MRATLIGSGAIGGGVIVPLLSEMGLEPPAIIARNQERAKTLSGTKLLVKTVSREADHQRDFPIGPVIAEDDLEQMKKWFSAPGPQLVCTAVRAENLDRVARTLSPALKYRLQQGVTEPVYLMPFENVPQSGKRMHDLLQKYGPTDGICTSSVVVDCMSFRPENGLIVREPFHDIVAKRTTPELDELFENTSVTLVDDTTPFFDRKITLVSGIHTAVAWWGLHHGIEYANDAVLACQIRQEVVALIHDVALAISNHFGLSFKEMNNYGRHTLERVDNPHLPDPCSRFTHNIPQKLSPEERFGKPAIMYFETTNKVPKAICLALVLGFSLASDEETAMCQRSLRQFPEPIFEEIQEQSSKFQS